MTARERAYGQPALASDHPLHAELLRNCPVIRRPESARSIIGTAGYTTFLTIGSRTGARRTGLGAPPSHNPLGGSGLRVSRKGRGPGHSDERGGVGPIS